MSFLSLTDRDRDEMLATIGVSSIDELFRDIPAGVRFDRELDLEPALSEQEIVSHLEELAARNVDTGRELSFLGAGIYDHYVPAVVDAVLQRGELLTAYTPYQAEMSQGVLQAIFEYQTAICELTGMDVSNASGYDGTTVAADACYVAKHVTGRSRVVLAETLNPQVRQVVKTYAPGSGSRSSRCRIATGSPTRTSSARPLATPRASSSSNRTSSAASSRRRISRPPRTTPARSPSPTSTRSPSACSRRRASTAARSRSAKARRRATTSRTADRTTGSWPRAPSYVRRMPGRIVGETTDVEGRRAYVLTLQTREQHIRREKATSNITTNQTLLALAGLAHLAWLGPQGLREQGETCMALAAYAKERLGLPLVFPDRATFKEFAVRVGRPADEAIRAARANGVHPGYALRRDYAGMEDALLVCVTEKRTEADIDRLAEVLAA